MVCLTVIEKEQNTTRNKIRKKKYEIMYILEKVTVRLWKSIRVELYEKITLIFSLCFVITQFGNIVRSIFISTILYS